jgi:hypothetical protein
MTFRLDLDQLRKQAKERVRARRAAGEVIKLSEAQLELAREHGFASWPKLKSYVERLGFEQPFRTDIETTRPRREGRQRLAASASPKRERSRPGVTVSELAAAARPGGGAAKRQESPTPFMLAYRCRGERTASGSRSADRNPELIAAHQRHHPLGMAGTRARRRPSSERRDLNQQRHG